MVGFRVLVFVLAFVRILLKYVVVIVEVGVPISDMMVGGVRAAKNVG